jgi:hypothetical protein
MAIAVEHRQAVNSDHASAKVFKQQTVPQASKRAGDRAGERVVAISEQGWGKRESRRELGGQWFGAVMRVAEWWRRARGAWCCGCAGTVLVAPLQSRSLFPTPIPSHREDAGRSTLSGF